MSVNRECMSSSSSSVGAQGPDVDSDSKIHDAEHCFVRKDFQTALHLANQVLQESAPTTRSHGDTVLVLNSACLSGNPTLVLGVDSMISTADRAGAIALQSMKEASLVDDLMLEPFLKFYSTSPMPLELLVVFICFLLNSEKQHCAIELASQVVHSLIHSPSTTKASEEIQEIKDELVWTLVTKLIPFCPDAQYLEGLSNECGAQTPRPRPASARRPKWRSEPLRPVVTKLISALDSLDGVATKDCLERCRDHLLLISGGCDAVTVASLHHNDENRAIIPMESRSSKAWINIMNPKGGYRKLISHLLNLLTSRVVKPLCRSDHNWEARSQATLTIFSLYVAWKQRQRIATALHLLVSLSLKPVQEIIDAALDQSRA
ncbi:hypothetical protein MHU86_4267 [Fragilaria crotonensis]|nr:hypothetical protein MHU86_4267 [Fragilaria crotonensis]